MSVNHIKSLLNTPKSFIEYLLFIRVVTIHISYVALLFQKGKSFNITGQNMIKNTHIISDYFLLDLQDVNVFRKLIYFFPANRINECCFTDTISPYQTIFSSSCQFYSCVLKECFSSNNDCDVWTKYICLTLILFIMHNSWRRNLFSCSN